MHSISLDQLQQYLREKDHRPERRMNYLLKLIEEVGELAAAVRTAPPPAKQGHLKGTVEEELCDVLYYTIALANLYEMDLTARFIEKEQLNDEKYHTQHAQKLGALEQDV